MALGDAYATLAELKVFMGGVSDTTDDTALTDALNAASRAIEKHTGRQFNKQADATARVFWPRDTFAALVDDFHTTTDLAIATDSAGDGTYATVWSSSDYQLLPLNGISDGESGWPYNQIEAVYTQLFRSVGRRAPLQVTAQWGWTAVPAAVRQACFLAAAEFTKLKDAPFGVAGFGEYGAVRVRENPKVAALLAPYRRHALLVA